jgi:uncharacterized protein YkwD
MAPFLRRLSALIVSVLALVGLAVAGAPAALAGAGSNNLQQNEQLNPGEQLWTSNGISLTMQSDGNLVERAPGNQPVWASGTNRAGSIVRMQSDGNLVIIAPGNVAVWSTGTGGNNGAGLELQTDGNLVVYAQGHVARWANGVNVATVNGPAADVVRLTNEERARRGCSALAVDGRLVNVAQAHAVDMAAFGYLSHTSRDGRTWDRRVRDAGYPNPAGENIARGQTSAAAVVQAWLNSPGHAANIRNCSFRTIGTGYDSRGHYWVQDFGY